MSYILIVLFGMITGIAVGLFPVLPIYLGPFLLYFIFEQFPVDHLLAFWICVLIGSQFFGSISTISLKIPGEASSLIYLNDINKMSLSERNQLLHSTALGSLNATIFSLLVVYVVILFFDAKEILFFSSLNFQMFAYTIAILSFSFINKNILITLFMLLSGIILGPKNNYVLPEYWYKVQMLFEGTTLFMVVLGMLIIPQVFLQEYKNTKIDSFEKLVRKPLNWFNSFKNSILGSIVGLIPGPCAEIASTLAYKFQRGNKSEKIIAAETANNSAVITLLLPFFVLGLPITQSTIIFSNIMDLKMINIPEVISGTSTVFQSITLIELLFFTIMPVSIVYYLLSTRFIDWYAHMVDYFHHKMKILMFVIVGLMIAVDLTISELELINYIILLSFYVFVGFLLEKKKINPIPFMFALLLGDRLIWTYIQFYLINFG